MIFTTDLPSELIQMMSASYRPCTETKQKSL